MSSGCGDVLSLADLQTAKKHQIFEAEVITGKQGGVAGGAGIDYATNPVTGQVQKTMPAVLRDAGFSPVSWDFSTGGTLTATDRDKVVYDPVSKTWYSYAGTLPVTVPAGFNPVGNVNWKPQTDPNLRAELGSMTPYAFDTVADIFSGITVGGQLVSLKTNDSAITSGGTLWRVLSDSPSAIANLEAQSPWNTLDFGADPTGVADSTQSFIDAGANSLVKPGTYKISQNISGKYFAQGPVVITGAGSVKTVPVGFDKRDFGKPLKLSNTYGGSIYTQGTGTYDSTPGEWYREPSFAHSTYNDRTYMVYVVLEGTKLDPGQSATQTSRIELRVSNNNLSFGAPVVLSTDGEPQAAEPSIVWDTNRGRIWVFYTTARGQVGVGYGAVGFDPNTTFQNWVTYSDDYGATWTAPVNITSQVKPYDATSGWFPPSPCIVAGNGDLILPYTGYDGVFSAYYILVKEGANGALTYERQLIIRGGPEGSQGGGEHQIIQLGDGSLLCMLRDYYNNAGNTIGRQQFLRSWDGVTWIKKSSVDTTNCKAGLTIFSQMTNGDSSNLLVMTAPIGVNGDYQDRANLRMWYSRDNGNTWSQMTSPVLNTASTPASYSSITPLNSGAFLVVAEGLNYTTLQVKHRAIGAFNLSSSFAKSWSRLPVTQTAGEASLCQYFDIPNNSLYYNSETQTVNMNSGGSVLRLTDSRKELDVTTSVSSLDSDVATTFYMSAASTLTSITGNARRVTIVSTTSAQPITLQDSGTGDIATRIRSPKTLNATAVVLIKTKFGWYISQGA